MKYSKKHLQEDVNAFIKIAIILHNLLTANNILTEFLNYFITFSNFKVVNSQSEFRKCEIVQKWHENNYAHRHIYLLFFNAVPANLRPRTLYHVKLQVT